jgi:hypothetical protein
MYIVNYNVLHDIGGFGTILAMSCDQNNGTEPLIWTNDVSLVWSRNVIEASWTICSVSTSLATYPCKLKKTFCWICTKFYFSLYRVSRLYKTIIGAKKIGPRIFFILKSKKYTRMLPEPSLVVKIVLCLSMDCCFSELAL